MTPRGPAESTMATLVRDVAALSAQVRRLDEQTELNANGLDTLESALEDVHALAARQHPENADDDDLDAFTTHQRLQRLDDMATRALDGLDELESALSSLTAPTPQTSTDMAAAMAARARALTPPAPEPPESAPPEDTAGQPPPVELPRLARWVEAFIAPLVRKATVTGEGAGIRWCRTWWRHRDARDRLDALRRAYGELAANAEDSPSWWSVYLRDHLDPHLSVLTSPTGPFYACTPQRHSEASEPLGQHPLPGPPPAETPPGGT